MAILTMTIISIMTLAIVTGVCKINGVVIVVNCCYSIGFSTTNNNKNTVYFANTGNNSHLTISDKQIERQEQCEHNNN